MTLLVSSLAFMIVVGMVLSGYYLLATESEATQRLRTMIPHLVAAPARPERKSLRIPIVTRILSTIGRYGQVARAFRDCPKPIVAAIHGHALAGGFELACLCDIRIAAEDARFGLPDVPLGLSPTSGLTYLLPRIVGLGRALDLALSGEPIDAREALRIGLVTRVVDAGALPGAAQDLAGRLAAFPAVAMASSKRGFYAALEAGFAAAIAAEGEAELACFRETATREGFRAFLDRKRH